MPTSLGMACAQGLPGAAQAGPLPTGTAWVELLAAAVDERAIPFLATAVFEGLLEASSEQAEALTGAHEDLMRACLMLERSTLEVASVFESTEVPFRVLKGPAVAHLDYPDPSWRAFGDVDVLVPSRSYDAAVRALENLGAHRRSREVRPGFDRRFGKGACLVLPDGVQVDLHRTLATGPFGLAIDLDRLFDEQGSVRLGNREIPTLSREHRFIHACYHASLGDAVPRIVALRDVAQLLLTTDLDFARARATADAWRGGIVLARAISVAWERFALVPTPASEWASGYVGDRFERRALAAYVGPNRSYARQMAAAVPAVPGLSAKFAFVRSLLFVDRAYAKRHDGGYVRRVRRAWNSRTLAGDAS